MSSASTPTMEAARHEIYIPRYGLAKLGLALLGLVLLVLSLDKFIPLARLAFAGGRATAEAVRIVRLDAGGQETVLDTDAAVLNAVKAIEEARDFVTYFFVEYRFVTADGRAVEARSPLGQRVKPLQPLRDRDGLPSTISVWYGKSDPRHIALPFQLGTWFMPGMVALFGALGMGMGLILWWNAARPIEMPDLSRSHAEKDNGGGVRN